MAILDKTAGRKVHKRHKRRLTSFKSKSFDNALFDAKKHILNFPGYELSELERFVLWHSLNFGLSPKSVSKQQIFAEFEFFWAQLQHHSAASNGQRGTLKARLTNLPHIFCDSKIDTNDFVTQKECFAAINKLRKNIEIAITKPRKGLGVNKCDCIKKMENILADPTKYEHVGPASSCDTTSSTRLKKCLLELFKADLLPENVFI